MLTIFDECAGFQDWQFRLTRAMREGIEGVYSKRPDEVEAFRSMIAATSACHIASLSTAMLIQRLLFGFFWSSLFETARNIRTGHFDFFLAQPGNVMFMATTRKLDLDSLVNTFVAAGVVIYAANQLGLSPGLADLALYLLMIGCGLLIHYSALVLTVSLAFWITNAQGLEGSYFTLFEFSRIPRQAFKGAANILFVWALPAVIVSNIPAHTLLHGFDPGHALWLLGATVAWFTLACTVFHRGLRRYSSASS